MIVLKSTHTKANTGKEPSYLCVVLLNLIVSGTRIRSEIIQLGTLELIALHFESKQIRDLQEHSNKIAIDGLEKQFSFPWYFLS